MANKLYVGNVPFRAEAEDLKQHFAQVGEVVEVQIVKERDTDRSRGFAFVTMASDELAQQAMSQLNGQPFNGRELRISEARPPRNG